MLTLTSLQTIIGSAPRDAWKTLLESAWSICSQPIESTNPVSEILQRDHAISSMDLLLASAAWDLWLDYYDSVPRTSEELVKWWDSQFAGCAVLILDGLSLREAPWLIAGARARGFRVEAKVTCSELPGDTNSFARALNVGQRSSLENNKAPRANRLKNATTDSASHNWIDCAELIGPQPNWMFWHHWPDNRIHDLGAQAGHGLTELTKEVIQQLTDDSFWKFIDRLATGRTLVITSDHGYAATGLFPDVADSDQANYLKTTFSSGRHAQSGEVAGTWVPPLELSIRNSHVENRLCLGRRRWKSPGGYPTLAHGGLTILECASPFIQLTR